MNRRKLSLLTKVILEHSLRVTSDDVLVVSGSPATYPLIYEIVRQCVGAGARTLVQNQSGLCLETHVPESAINPSDFYNPFGVSPGTRIDCTIDIRTNALASTAPRVDDLDADTMRRKQSLFLKQAATGELRWVAVAFATAVAATAAGMSCRTLERVLNHAGMLHHRDVQAAWQRIHTRQEALCRVLNDASEIKFKTIEGTNLKLQVGGRCWINCAGRFNFPDGEVFTAPLENGVDGVFYSKHCVRHDGIEIRGVRLCFRSGQITDASAKEGETALLNLISQDPGASLVGEIGIGTNYEIAKFTGISLLDEKIGGTFHIALGAAYPQSGGTNQSAVHRDFVADLRCGGTITVDGVVVSRDGQFQLPGWQPNSNRNRIRSVIKTFLGQA